ncbi:MAG: M48 family peptidase [Rhodospirillales bacterium]|nr:MAG: M48 family peptidase [Rhodospirillales bacterium]
MKPTGRDSVRRRGAGLSVSSGTIELAGRPVPLTMRRNDRAVRLRLSIDRANAGVVLTLPNRVSEAQGIAFLHDRSDWVIDHLARLPQRIAFIPGAAVPILGVEHEIRHVGRDRAGIQRANGELRVSGAIDAVPGRVAAWLRAAARQELEGRADALARRLHRTVRRISIRDTRSRWGSCSAAGNLSFSWRLIMSLGHVVDYVAAHEVAHLLEHNHGAAFWVLVESLVGDTGAARSWLKEHGPGLLRYG